jgi:hypothetical protein
VSVEAESSKLESMRNGFVVDERFRDYGADDLCVTWLRVAVRAEEKEGMVI